MKQMSANFKQRLIVSLLSICVLIATIYLSTLGIFKLVFLVLAAAMIGAALWEFYHLAKLKGYAPLMWTGIILSLLYVVAIFLSTQTKMASQFPLAALGAMLLIPFLYYLGKGRDPFINLAVTFFGFFYLTLPLSCLIYVNYFFPPEASEDGRWWLFYLIAVTKMTDIGAYCFGKLFGKHQLTPYISPKKTWEGALGGVAAAVVMSIGFYVFNLFFRNSADFSFFQSLWMGVLLSILAQLGDLTESLLKRDLGAKDSNQLPGLGGILDMLDSLVFTIPFLYIFLKMAYT
jgi:phosphatidate cytidylyltransferase